MAETPTRSSSLRKRLPGYNGRPNDQALAPYTKFSTSSEPEAAVEGLVMGRSWGRSGSPLTLHAHLNAKLQSHKTWAAYCV